MLRKRRPQASSKDVAVHIVDRKKERNLHHGKVRNEIQQHLRDELFYLVDCRRMFPRVLFCPKLFEKSPCLFTKSAIYFVILSFSCIFAKEMRNGSYHTAIQALLEHDDVLSASDFMSACPGVPAQTVYSKIRSLVGSGKLSPVGKGKYICIHKPAYQPMITSWMRSVNDILIEKCPGISHCLAQRSGNLFVYAAKTDLPRLHISLMEASCKVIWEKDWKRFPTDLEGFIVLCKLVSDSPVLREGGVSVPSIEKELVDRICDGRHTPDLLSFQKTLEVYPVNVNRLNRYAARRGATDKVSAMMKNLDRERMVLMSQLQRCLASIPVTKAWVFGSYARGEETAESDLDLLVDYDKTARLSLLDIVRMKLDLEKALGKEVDLIENGYLKPFAVPSVERDKYLVYER